MSEKRLQNIETMVSQLITMVGTLQVEQNGMKGDMQNMQGDLQDLKNGLDRLEEKGEKRHKEILARLKDIEMDQDIIWDKVSQHEREIEHIKRKLG